MITYGSSTNSPELFKCPNTQTSLALALQSLVINWLLTFVSFAYKEIVISYLPWSLEKSKSEPPPSGVAEIFGVILKSTLFNLIGSPPALSNVTVLVSPE